MRIGNFGAIILGILFLIVAIFITAVMFGWTSPLQTIIQQISDNMIYSGLAAVGFLLLAILAFSMVRFGDKEQIAASTSTQFGQIRISDRTIAGIVSRAGANVEGVKEADPKIFPTPQGIIIQILTVVNPEFVIPKVIEELQAAAKEDVEKYTGLKVTEVKVMVQSLDTASSIRMR
ncbi:MAG TPA: alkaline shock response membrane anchor protein AmaP [Verrucomicrobiae bacterium]|nr:alkaline shock response membrane anchor protein AmaP [Verrucomicrobiae bacterium]